jgi:DNA-binding ferritin-like protein
MSNDSNARISAFSKDIQHIAEDVEHLAEDLSHDSRMMRDEVVGAEILATKEVTEAVGILWEVAERLNTIGGEQMRYLFDDYAATYEEFIKTPGLHNYADVVMNHWLRRMDHIADGTRSVANLVTRETNLLEDVIFGMWKPFVAVLNRDWSSRAQGPVS